MGTKQVILLITAGAAMSLAATAPAATPPTLTSPPQVSPAPVVADNTTPYTVTVTFSDVDGYNSIRCVRVLFNYTEANGDQAQGRGVMAWGKTDGDVAQYGGSWVLGDAAGGGRWGYRTDVWSGTTYMTPLSCQITASGSASAGTGSLTVSWTFSVKTAWGFNPVMNDTDTWAADGVIGETTYTVGWIHGQQYFDVVSAPCSTYCATPQPPVLSNPTPNSVDVSIHPSDSSSDLYAIMVSPSVGGRRFVQLDGTLNTTPRWNSRADWGTKTVSGLLPGMTYSFSARASRSEAAVCPSAWSHAEIQTVASIPVIHPYGGTPFSPWVRGQCPFRSVGGDEWGVIWDRTIGSTARGVAGGLDADCYDWRDIDSGSGWGTPAWSGRYTTLEFLRQACVHGAAPLFTANVFGGGYRDWTNTGYPGVFVCQSINPEGLAADWVRYTNHILQNYRQGDEASLSGEDLRVYNSISNWGTKPKLLTTSEAVVPRVQYWEIGNEPELGGYGSFLTNHYLAPAAYRDRYKSISAAMLAVDPTLKFGPCLIDPADAAGSGQWLSALAADPAVKLDFVAYHPYYGAIKSYWGHPDGMTNGLRGCKSFLNGKTAAMRSTLSAYSRACDFIASEWNAVNWDAPDYMQASMASALGTAETCFAFAEDGVLAGAYWAKPNRSLGVKDTFAGLVDHMGDTLIMTGDEMGYGSAHADFRVYVTRDSRIPDVVMIWGLNFHDSQSVTVNLSLAECALVSATLKHYGKAGPDSTGGDTTLTMSSGMTWDQQDVTATVDPANFPFTLEDAEITLLILRIQPVDSDGDGSFDHLDNCPSVSNPQQVDSDRDGIGDACDACPGHDDKIDTDGDGKATGCDNCPGSANPDQADRDNDDVGDACDACPGTIPGVLVDASGCPLSVKADFDRDGDVDLDDFGHIQACLSGSGEPQNDPACQDARLDEGSDVDREDVLQFRACLSGANVPADPDCAD
jgi:hypothetical protein